MLVVCAHAHTRRDREQLFLRRRRVYRRDKEKRRMGNGEIKLRPLYTHIYICIHVRFIAYNVVCKQADLSLLPATSSRLLPPFITEWRERKKHDHFDQYTTYNQTCQLPTTVCSVFKIMDAQSVSRSSLTPASAPVRLIYRFRLGEITWTIPEWM